VSADDSGTTWDAGVVADASVIADASEVADASVVADAATPDTTGADSPPVMACGTTGLPSLTNLSPVELSASLESKDFLLINVASASGGQIPQTDTYIPYDDTEALVAFIGPDLDTEVVLYCNSGGRSRVAGNSLVALGYCQVSHLAGGKNAWVAAGYELE
jgi:rhodanese-related sulfurtransferase